MGRATITNADRRSALIRLLDHYGVKFNVARSGWQAVKCLNPEHDDRAPSASVNMIYGGFKCHACGLTGDAIKVFRQLTGAGFKEALQELGIVSPDGQAAPAFGQTIYSQLPEQEQWI